MRHPTGMTHSSKQKIQTNKEVKFTKNKTGKRKQAGFTQKESAEIFHSPNFLSFN